MRFLLLPDHSVRVNIPQLNRFFPLFLLSKFNSTNHDHFPHYLLLLFLKHYCNDKESLIPLSTDTKYIFAVDVPMLCSVVLLTFSGRKVAGNFVLIRAETPNHFQNVLLLQLSELYRSTDSYYPWYSLFNVSNSSYNE